MLGKVFKNRAQTICYSVAYFCSYDLDILFGRSFKKLLNSFPVDGSDPVLLL